MSFILLILLANPPVVDLPERVVSAPETAPGTAPGTAPETAPEAEARPPLNRETLEHVRGLIEACAATPQQRPQPRSLLMDAEGRLAGVDFDQPFDQPLDEAQRCLRAGLEPRPLARPNTLAITWPDATKPQPFPPVAPALRPWMLVPMHLRCPATASILARPATPCVTADGTQILFAPVTWGMNRDVLTREGLAAVDAVGALLQAVPAITRVEVQVHGNPEPYPRAMDLTARRARTLRDALVRLGIEARRIEAVGYSDQRPLASPSKPAGRALNLRTEIHIRAWAP